MSINLIGKAVKELRLPIMNYDMTAIKVIPMQSGDVNSRFFFVKFYDDRGTIDLSQYYAATLNATLPDDTKQISYGEIDVEKNAAIIQIPSSMLTCKGKVTCDIALQGADDNNNISVLTSQTFYLFVSLPQSRGVNIESDYNYTVLQQLLETFHEVEEERNAAEAIRAKNEAIRLENEAIRLEDEAIRLENEANRISFEEARESAESNRQDI